MLWLARSEYLDLTGTSAEGTMMPSTKLMVPDQLADNDPQKKIIHEFVTEYENVKKYRKVSTHSVYAWDAIMLMVNSMRKAGSTEILKKFAKQWKTQIILLT